REAPAGACGGTSLLSSPHSVVSTLVPLPGRTPAGAASDAESEQVGHVARIDRVPIGGRQDVHLLEVRDRGADVTRALLRVERAVGGEERALDAEEPDGGAHRVTGPEVGGVDVELPEVVDGAPGQRVAGDVGELVRRGPGAELVPAGADAAGEVRDHRAAVVDEDLDVRQPLQDAGEDETRHVGREDVLPAEGPPELELRA